MNIERVFICRKVTSMSPHPFGWKAVQEHTNILYVELFDVTEYINSNIPINITNINTLILVKYNMKNLPTHHREPIHTYITTKYCRKVYTSAQRDRT